MNTSVLTRITQNWKAALTVSLVSIPLSLALAIASGATPTQGIITALWAGIIAALLGGSHFNIVGPTGALSGILVVYAFSHGFIGLSYVAILAGVFIFLAFVFRLDRYIIFIPNSVIHGFTLGVAGMIALNQLDNALGLSGVEKTEHLLLNTFNSLQQVSHLNLATFVLFVLGVAFIFFWNKRFAKMPGSAILAAVGILISLLLSRGVFSGISLATLGQVYPDISPAFFTTIFTQADPSMFFHRDMWVISLTVAIVAILETLLSGQIAEQKTKIPFDRRKEVFGLSLANIGSGLCGGIPATAALARTSLNIKSGATHRTSGVIQTLFLVLFTFVFISYFKLLPMAVVAAILVYVSITLVERHHFIRLLNNEKISFGISLLVAAVTVIIDPMIGIVVGTVIALLVFASEMSKGKTDVLFFKKGQYVDSLPSTMLKSHSIDSDIVVYKISGALTYLNMPAHIQSIKHITGYKHVVISLRHAFYADSDGLAYLGELISILKKHNGGVVLSGINGAVEAKLKKEAFYYLKLNAKKVYKRSEEAVIALSDRSA